MHWDMKSYPMGWTYDIPLKVGKPMSIFRYDRVTRKIACQWCHTHVALIITDIAHSHDTSLQYPDILCHLSSQDWIKLHLHFAAQCQKTLHAEIHHDYRPYLRASCTLHIKSIPSIKKILCFRENADYTLHSLTNNDYHLWASAELGSISSALAARSLDR